MLRIAGATLGGYALIAILVSLTDLVFGAVIPEFQAMKALPLYYFAVSLCTGALYTVAGSWLCSWIARKQYRTACWALLAVGEVAGVVSMIVYWRTIPHWYSFALLLVFPPAICAGALAGARPAARSARG